MQMTSEIIIVQQRKSNILMPSGKTHGQLRGNLLIDIDRYGIFVGPPCRRRRCATDSCGSKGVQLSNWDLCEGICTRRDLAGLGMKHI
jgi:hypothetical protein